MIGAALVIAGLLLVVARVLRARARRRREEMRHVTGAPMWWGKR